MDHKIILGYISIAIAVFSYAPYFWGIYQGRIKPHGFTWFAWGVLQGIGFIASFISGGGAGSWILLFYSVICFTVALIAFRQGHVKYILFDWLALTGAMIGISLWIITKNPLLAVIFITLSDIAAFLPTIRKAYYLPNEESVTPWTVGIISYLLSIFALNSVNLITWLYPVVTIIANTIFVLEVFIRRRQLKAIKKLP